MTTFNGLNNGSMTGPFKKTVMALIIGSAMAGCSGGGGGGGSSPTPVVDPVKSSVSVSGTAVKGILAGAIVEAYDISGATLLAQTTTNDKGKYTLPAISHDGPILVKLKTADTTKAICDSAVGCKDSSGNTVAFGETYNFNDSNFSLSAVLPDAATAVQQELMVTPITHMAAQRVANDKAVTASDIKAINTATASLLGLDGVDINTVAPIDITDPVSANAGTAAQQLYGALVASIQTIAEKDPNSSVADIVNNLAADYSTDGGLTSNSADDAKVTLEEIFSSASEVIDVAKKAATDDNIVLDLGNAETTIALEETEAANATPDTEVVVEPKPDPEPAPELTQSEATAKGIALLKDLNTWQDALTADNQTLVQPFEDQLKGSRDILKGLEAQSKALQGFYSLVRNPSNADGDAEVGELVNTLKVVGSLAELAAYLQANHIDKTSFDYGNQNDFKIGVLTDLIETDVENEDVISYSLIANYTVKENKIDKVTFTLADLAAAPDFDNSASVILTQANFDDDSNKIAFNVMSASFNTPSEGLKQTIPSGEVSITFTSADARKAFPPKKESAATINAVNVNITSNAALTKVEDAKTVVTTGGLTLKLDSTKDSANATTSVVSLGIDISNDLNEVIKGDLIITAQGKFSEEDSEEGFSPRIDLADASVKFIGEIGLSSTDPQGASKSADFDGEIKATSKFLSRETSQDRLVDLGSAEIKGAISIKSGGNTTSFNGSAAVDMEVIKTPDGKPFDIGGVLYHTNKATLFGRLSTQKSNGDSATLNLNAAVTADISGVVFPVVSIPKRGDLFAELHYGIESVSADEARLYVNFKDAYDAGITKLKESNFVIGNTSNAENFEVNFIRSGCVQPSEQQPEERCDISFTTQNSTVYTFPPDNLTAEAKKNVFLNNRYSGLHNRSYIEDSSVVTFEDCKVFDNYEECKVNASINAKLLNQPQAPGAGLTEYVANSSGLIRSIVGFPSYAHVNHYIDTQYGEMAVHGNSAIINNINGIQATGTTSDHVLALRFNYFFSEVKLTQFDTKDAYIELSAALKIKADLTGLDDAELSVSAKRLGLKDAAATVKLINGARTIDLAIDSLKGLSNAEGTNLTISNADTTMTISADCVTKNPELNTHGITTCDGDVKFQGSVMVGGHKVADLEDRDGLPVFRFTDGTGLDLVATPNLLIQPSK